MVQQETTMLKVDKPTDGHLEILAKHENRTKIGELRFLVKERAKELGVKIK
jgi:hypothetical protein